MVLEDNSYGFVIFRILNNEVQFLLIKHKQGHWSFPKGHKNYGETELDAALREVKEETGISEIEILDDTVFFEEEYNYHFNRKPIKKTVKYYLGKVHQNKKVTPDNVEVTECKWENFNDASNTITFQNTIDILIQSNEAIKNLISI